MPDDPRWSWCNKNRKKMHNKCNELELSRNHPPTLSMEKLSSMKPVPQKAGECCSIPCILFLGRSSWSTLSKKFKLYLEWFGSLPVKQILFWKWTFFFFNIFCHFITHSSGFSYFQCSLSMKLQYTEDLSLIVLILSFSLKFPQFFQIRLFF